MPEGPWKTKIPAWKRVLIFQSRGYPEPLKYPHVRSQMGNFATASRRESDPFPQPGLGAYKGTLWDPLAKIAPGQVAGNSNLKFGVRPRPLRDKSRPSGTSACTPSHIRSRQMSRAVSLGFPWGSNVPDFELGYYGFRVGLLAENSPKPWVRPIPPSHASPAPA